MLEVLPTDIQVLEQNLSDSFLTLVTCVPPGHPLKPKRLIVRARIVPLGETQINNIVPVYPTFDTATGSEVVRRISLASLFNESFPIKEQEQKDFNDLYTRSIARALEGCQLNQDEFESYRTVYRCLLKSIL